MKNNSNYTLSISDLLMGFLFIFILILLKFMIDYQNKKTNLFKPLQERSNLLKDLKKKMASEKIKVEIDKENGVLKLTNIYYFSEGNYILSAKGKKDFKKIKKIFNILICYSDLNNPETKKRWLVKYTADNLKNWKKYCRKKYAKQYGLIDSILIEGHADSKPIGKELKKKGIETNVDLAMKRSSNIFKFLLNYEESTKKTSESGNYFYALLNKQRKPLFGMTSYGNLRRNLQEKKDRNLSSQRSDRRIDIRFIMSRSDDIQEHLKKNLK